VATGPDSIEFRPRRSSIRWRRPRRPFPRWLVAAITAVSAVLALAAADTWLRARELDAVLDRIAATEQTVRAAVGRRDGILANLVAADLRGLSPGDHARADRHLVRLARETARDLTVARGQVSSTWVAGWHGPVRTARDEYAERVGAWRRYWVGGVADRTRLRASEPRPGDIEPSLDEVAALLHRALPPLAPYDLAGRTRALRTVADPRLH